LNPGILKNTGFEIVFVFCDTRYRWNAGCWYSVSMNIAWFHFHHYREFR